MGYRPAPKGLPQTSHGYTVDFSRWPRSDLVGSGSFKEFGELATSTAQTLRIEEGGYIRSVDDAAAQYIGINPNHVGGFNGQGQFSECLCYLDATATQTNYWVGPAVFIGADQQSGVTSGEHHYTLLLNDAGGGTSDWQVYRRSDGAWNGLASATGEPDVAGKHFLLRLEAYVLPDNSGVRLKCWKDGKLIIEVVDTNVDRLLGPSTVASHPAYGYPGLSWGNNGIDDPARWVKWVRGGDLPELSDPAPSNSLFASRIPRAYLVDSATNTVAASTTLSITHGMDLRWNDVLIAIVHWNSSTAISNTNNDFALTFGEENPTAAGSYQSFFERRCTGSDPASFEFTNATSARANVILLHFRGVSPYDIWDVRPSSASRSTLESGTSLAAPSIFAGAHGNLALSVFFADNDGITFSGYDQGYHDEVEHGSGQGLAAVSKLIDSPGIKSGPTATSSGTGDIVAHHVSLKFLDTRPNRVYFKAKMPWTSRPPWGTPIDMTHPLAHKLKRFVMFDSGDIGYDFVQGVFGVPQANYGSNSVTKYGRAQNVIQSTGTQVHEWPDEATVIKNFGTLGHTFMGLARSDTAGTPSAKPNQEFIAAGETAGTDDLWNYRLLTDGSPRYTIYYDNGTIANSESPYPTGKDATDWCFHGGTWDADRNEIICRIDRAQDATPGSVPGTVGVGDSTTIFSVGSNGSSSSSWDGDIVFAAEWLRPLSDAEWDQMIDNPWQIFKPRDVIIGVGQSLTPVVESITTSGSNTAVEPAVLNYPAAGIEAGDLLIMLIGNDGSADLPDFPTGAWDDNKLLRATPTVGGFGQGASWKIADGTENGGTEEVGFSAGVEEWAGAIIHIKNWQGTTPPQISSVSSENSNDSMAVSLNPSWSSDDGTLWIWFLSGDGGALNVGSWATIGDYFPDNQIAYSPGAAAPCAAIATSYEKIETKAKIAGVNDLSVTDPHAEFIIAVRGAVEGGLVVITDVANSGETPGAGSESWDDGSTGNVITGTNFL